MYVSLSMYRCISVSINLSIYRYLPTSSTNPTYLSTCLPFLHSQCTYLLAYLPAYLFNLPTCLPFQSTYLFYQSTYLSTCLPTGLPFLPTKRYLSTCLLTCLPFQSTYLPTFSIYLPAKLCTQSPPTCRFNITFSMFARAVLDAPMSSHGEPCVVVCLLGFTSFTACLAM